MTKRIMKQRPPPASSSSSFVITVRVYSLSIVRLKDRKSNSSIFHTPSFTSRHHPQSLGTLLVLINLLNFHRNAINNISAAYCHSASDGFPLALLRRKFRSLSHIVCRKHTHTSIGTVRRRIPSKSMDTKRKSFRDSSFSDPIILLCLIFACSHQEIFHRPKG